MSEYDFEVFTESGTSIGYKYRQDRSRSALRSFNRLDHAELKMSIKISFNFRTHEVGDWMRL